MSDGSVNQSIFGGGNKAPVSRDATVIVTGGAVIGNVYGGGNQAEVKGLTKVVIGRQSE